MQLHPQYYYQQLPPQERAAYHGMLTCLQALAPSARIPRLPMETLGTLFFQLRLDHPEIFYAVGFSCRAVPEAAFVEFWPEYRFEKKRIREHRQAIEARVTRLLRPLRSLPPVEQERAIHDFIVENVRYDKLEKPYSHEVIGPLTNGVGVCEGMAKTVKLLCDGLGLPCMIAVSDRDRANGERYLHAWNIVQLGGQTPLSLAARLKAAGVPILGTTPESIDLAENRELFGEVLKKARMNAPRYGTALSLEEAQDAARSIGYPVLVRPSYVLGGRGMEIVYDDAQLEKYVNRALAEAQADTVVSGRLPSPLLIDKFLQDAIEVDVDALFDGEELYIGGIMEHVEEAGVHSGDAACTLPPSTLSDDQIRRLREGTYAIAKGCGVQGLINVQYAFMANTLYVIEANPRASRTVPFASKATGVALAKAAARIMAGETIAQQRANGLLLPEGDGGVMHVGQQVAVKESVLPFKRFRTPVGKTVDILLGPEMRSTGEVMGFDRDFPHAFAKSQLAAYDGGLPTSGNVFISVNDSDKRSLPLMAVRLVELGFTLWATEGTASVLRRYGIESKIVDKITARVDTSADTQVEVKHAEGSVGKNVVELIEEGKIDMVLNTPNSRGSRSDGYSIRAAAIAADLPQFTTMTEFSAVLMAIEAVKRNDYQIMSIQEHAQQLFDLERS